MKYMIIAGEASGDLHGSQLIARLRKYDSKAKFVFFGGDLMAREARTNPAVHYREMNYMGFSEVIRNIGKVRDNLKLARLLLRKVMPDALILIDYPSFNLKVAKTAKELGIKVFYYISPKVWAWKEWRVASIKKYVDRMFVIFPFEVDWYSLRHNYLVQYAGNPSVMEIDEQLAGVGPRADFLSRNKLRDRPLIALLPGSRRGEIRNNLPVMVKAVKQFPQYRAVIAAAPSVDPEIYREFTDLPLVTDSTVELLSHSRAAIVTSGTATLEAALVGTPQVAVYRANGNKLTYNMMRRLISVDYVTLPNLILDREAIPELLLHFCTPDSIALHLARLLPENRQRQKMIDDYAAMRQRLGTGDAADFAARGIIASLRSAGQ